MCLKACPALFLTSCGPHSKTSWQTKMSTYSDMVRLCHLEFSPTFRILLLTLATMPGRSISMPGIHIGGHMYGWDTPNELTMVRTSLGSHNKMFQTGAVAWGGSGSGSGLISIGPGSSGSISWRASHHFAVGL